MTSVPTSSDTTIVRVANTRPASGSDRSMLVNTASRPLAIPMPAPIPISDAIRPSVSASSSTEPRT